MRLSKSKELGAATLAFESMDPSAKKAFIAGKTIGMRVTSLAPFQLWEFYCNGYDVAPMHVVLIRFRKASDARQAATYPDAAAASSVNSIYSKKLVPLPDDMSEDQAPRTGTAACAHAF